MRLLIIIIFFLLCCCSYSERNVQKPYQKYEEKRDKIEEENKKLDAELKIKKQDEYTKWLEENRCYPMGYFIGPGVGTHYSHEQNILILTIENNYPVTNKIDIINNELVIKDKFIHDKVHYERSYGKISIDFWSNNGSIQFYDDDFIRLFQGQRERRGSYKFIEKFDETIPEEVMALSSDNQKQYIGNFVFNNYQIITQENCELDEIWEESIKKDINITFNEEGYLIGTNMSIDGDLRFKILSINGNKTIYSYAGDMTLRGVSRGYYFKDKNTINYTHEFHMGSDDSDWSQSFHYIVEYLRH
jgi:hypothetical protein